MDLVGIVKAHQVVNGNAPLAVFDAVTVPVVHQFLEIGHGRRFLLQHPGVGAQRAMLRIGAGHIDDVTGIDVKVHPPGTCLAGDAAGMGVGGLKLEGIDTAHYHPIQRIALPVKGMNIDVVIADHPSVLIQGEHPLQRDVKGQVICRRWS